jgi:hypothetical protein
MKKYLGLGSLAVLLLGAPAGVFAERGSAGAEPLGALFFDGNSRPTAMGGAYSALAWDANALIYNPAGLARISRHEATFMHNQSVQGLTQDYLAAATQGGWGGAVNYVHVGNIPRTTIRDQDETLDNFAVSALVLSGGYGRTFFDTLSLGAAAKLIRESMDDNSAHAFAGDAGVLYSVPGTPGLNLGAAFQNIGPRVRFGRETERLPTAFRGGASYAFKVRDYDSTVAVDLIKDLHGKARIGLGGETVVARKIAVRVGWASRNDADYGVTAGLGWRFPNFSIDYAIVPFGELGFTHRISATARWGAAKALKARDPWPRQPLLREAPDPSELDRKSSESARLESADSPADSALTDSAPTDAAPAPLTPEVIEAQKEVKYLEQDGSISFLSTDLPRATAAYMEALRKAGVIGMKGPVVANAYAGLGLCLVEEGDTPRAMRAFERGLAAGPSPETKKLIEEQVEKIKK